MSEAASERDGLGDEVAPGLRTAIGDDGVHTWWLCNEARRNAISPGALRWIAATGPTLAGEIVVLRGVGGRAFCAGFDLTALAEATAPRQPGGPSLLPDEALIAATSAMRRANATFVAALDGYAIGAGVELACACDLRLARRGVFLAVPAAELGVVYHAAGLQSIAAALGPAGVRRLLLLGDRLDAEEAWSLGALIRLCDPDDFEAALSDVLDRLRRGAPLSIQGNRELLRALERGAPSTEQLEDHEARRHAAYASEDHREARQARIEGRPPRFRGR
ncbi:enoyl-CoA hydratase-related protein [Paraliomyxa miuraensis]|uniref:enoyl-CoA hydratase-related protein n=1 Tax=Paraliomyxa miuraensis TaxID=376150 RepID=UPI00225AB157|nr:enoyl-CoA hydratase-related protein [Paraliomyxa miuraensis]MCX4240003.1 enoyl-CoA hydratase-related protein [Paraliomyxa miuraensis]